MRVNGVPKVSSSGRQVVPVHPLEFVRRRRGFSRRELGRRVDRSKSAVSLWERGLMPPADRREAVARVLDVEVADIWPSANGGPPDA